MTKRIVMVLALTLIGGTSHAQFSGPSVFSSPPTSQLGPVTNNLVLTDTANGFFVSGQALITVPPGPQAGILVQWTVDRPLDPSYGTGTFTTTTVLDGFSQPPIGIYGNTSGSVQSEFTNFPGVSLSQIPISLTAGAATWNNLTNTSGSFFYTSGGTNYLRQQFFVDGVQQNGPGGQWIVDVPVTTFATLVPEPTTLLMLSVGFGTMVLGRRHRR